MPRLPVDLATEFRQTGGVTDGLELFRKLTNKLDPARSDNAFHLVNEIRGLVGLGACKSFDQTVRFVHFLEKKQKEYLIETGELFPDTDAARFLSDGLDEETMGHIDDSTDKDLVLTNYEPVKDWILQRDTKLKARTSTRHKSLRQGSR